jgi:hypothetical protein
VADVVLLGGRPETADRHVLDHAQPQGTDQSVEPRETPVWREAATPTISREPPASRFFRPDLRIVAFLPHKTKSVTFLPH